MHKTEVRHIRLPQLAGDIKQLKRKFRSAEIDLKYAERLLEAGQVLPQTDAYPGFENHKIFKTRVVNTDSARGKSAGYRLIYEKIEIQNEALVLLIFLYHKSTCDDENEVRIEVRTRLRSPEYAQLA
jgi:mRNA-degrading endonuclease RelE of RelBE toxin-antitoxin system